MGGRTQRRSKKAALKAKLASSLIQFGRAINPDAAKVENPAFHFEMEKRLMDLSLEKFNTVAPRGTAKSTLVAIWFVLWHVFLEPLYREMNGHFVRKKADGSYEPAYVLIISKTWGDAVKRLRTIKYILGDNKAGRQSRFFKALFGDYGESTALKWTDDLVILRDGTVIQCLGTGQNVHGLNEAGVRPTLIVCDDPENEENTKTPEAKKHNIRWLFQAIEPALDPQTGRLVVIGTPIDLTCMVVRLHTSYSMTETVDATSLWFQQDREQETSRWSVSPDGDLVLGPDDRVEEDKHGRWIVKPGLLWPAWYGPEKLDAVRHKCANTEGVGIGVYYRMYECKVVGDDEQTFLPHWFAFTWRGELLFDVAGNPYLEIYERHGKRLDKPEHVAVCVTVGLDQAYSTSSTADRSAIATIATDARDNIYELPPVYERMDSTVLLDTIEANHVRTKPQRAMGEGNGAQIALLDALFREKGLRYLPDPMVRQKKKGEGGRIELLAYVMKPGGTPHAPRPPRFHHHPGSPAKEEGLSYPRGDDDYLDALEKAVRIRMRPWHEVVLNRREDRRAVRMATDPMLA